MKRVNAYLENEPRSYNPSSQDFFIFEYEYNDYAVGTEDFCVYQVIDWNPLEDEDSNVDILYTDGNGLYFNYAEDGDFDVWLQIKFRFNLNALGGFYEEDALKLLAESDDLSDFASKWVKNQVEEYGNTLKYNDLSEALDNFVELSRDGWGRNEYYDTIVDEFINKIDESLSNLNLCAVDNDDIRETYDDSKTGVGDLYEIGDNDVTFDDVNIYLGATTKIHISGYSGSDEYGWFEDRYYKPKN